jgi:hypothetical protein
MPELPEVDAARRLAAGVALGRRIVEVSCAADPIVFADPPAQVRRALIGRRVVGRRPPYHVVQLVGRRRLRAAPPSAGRRSVQQRPGHGVQRQRVLPRLEAADHRL